MVEEGGRRGGGGGGVPEKVMEAVTTTLSTIQHLTSNHLLPLHPQFLADLPPLQRAECLLDLVKLTTNLFALRLRCSGVHPEDHEVTAEFERVRRYQSKLAHYLSLSKGARRSDRGKGQLKRRVQL